MSRILVSLSLFLSLTVTAGCGDDGGDGGNPDARPTADASTADAPEGADGAIADAGPDGGEPDGGEPDAAPDAGNPSSAQIATARATADGAGLALAIDNVYVTYLKPAVGGDPAGFTIQAEQMGPALFVTVDPASLDPAVAVGDEISFTITEMSTYGTLRQAAAIANLTVHSSGNDLSGLVQEVSAATDLVGNLDGYESELVTVSGTVTGTFASAGSGFRAAVVETAGVSGDNNLRLRLPIALQDETAIAQGCQFTVTATPVGRFNAQTQLAAFYAADLAVSNCPAPKVTGAVAPAADTVVVSFDRQIDPASVLGDGSQFTFDNDLTASAASANGNTVTVTTSAQTAGTAYTVTVAETVTDTLGTGVDAGANAATFTGFLTLAVVRINELNANITSGCDLIELRVISGGTIEGYVLKERTTTLYTFPAMIVATDDLIVVHINANSSTCNPDGATAETAAKDEQPAAQYAGNYDTAYDVWSTDSGLVATDNVFTLYDSVGTIIDAVLATDDPTGTAAADSETQAAVVAAANQWQMVGGGVPDNGFVDDDFNAHAALDLNGTGTSAAGESIQRKDDTDNNDKDDWVQAASSWGALNAGQTAQ